MSLNRLGTAVLTVALVAMAAMPAYAAPKEKVSQKELDKHAVEFVAANPNVYTDSTVLDAYTTERMRLLGIGGEPNVVSDGDVSILCGSFCYEIQTVHSITTRSKVVDDEAFPVWENTVKALVGSGGAKGTWSATWYDATESSWHVDAEASGTANVALLGKIEIKVGGGYARKTTTSWSGTTQISFDIPAGKKQTLYAYEKGTYWTFDCDCTVATSGGLTRTTVTYAASGLEAYPYQSTTFVKGPILNL